MPEKIKSGFGRLAGAVREFTVAQRTLALLAIGILLVGVAALTVWAMKPSYTPLYSGLSGQDAAAITDQLASDGVDYELADGGSTIMVPEPNVYEQRLKASAAGLPAEEAAGGYTLLDEMGVTSSEFQQDVTYKRALEGELARTVAAMGGVETASVQLAVPEDTVFADNVQNPTAAVFVATKAGKPLSTEQVESIIHLTSASIPGMDPMDVAVIDSEGTVLSAVGEGTTGSASDQASDYEERVATQVLTMLEQVVGVGNATVAVAADVNTASAERLTEEFAVPQGEPSLNESTITEDYEGVGGGRAGVLGPDNIAVPDGEAGQNTYTSEENTRNNAINKVTETTTLPAGDITRQTVSVALNVAAAGALDQGAITDLVAAAAGVDPQRGDLVEVQVLPFDNTAADAAAAALEAEREALAAAQRAELVRNTVLAGAVLLALVLWLIARSAKRRREEKRQMVDIGELDLIAGDDDGHALELPDVPERPAAIEEDPEERPEIGPPKARFSSVDQRRAEIDALAGADPSKTADYLRSLMDADRVGAPR